MSKPVLDPARNLATHQKVLDYLVFYGSCTFTCAEDALVGGLGLGMLKSRLEPEILS